MLRLLFQDWQANPHDLRIRLVLVAFRLAQRVGRARPVLRCVLSPYLALYRILVFWFFHMELHWALEAGKGLRIYHGYCLVIHPETRIGKGVTLRHCVTLGNKGEFGGVPDLQDGVEVGAHAIIVGPITVGRNSIIGAGAVVTKDVPPDTVVVGNPGRFLRSVA